MKRISVELNDETYREVVARRGKRKSLTAEIASDLSGFYLMLLTGREEARSCLNRDDLDAVAKYCGKSITRKTLAERVFNLQKGTPYLSRPMYDSVRALDALATTALIDAIAVYNNMVLNHNYKDQFSQFLIDYKKVIASLNVT